MINVDLAHGPDQRCSTAWAGNAYHQTFDDILGLLVKTVGVFELTAVRHIARGKGIPPFLILHVADHTDTTAQAHRLWSELREAGVPAKMFGAAGTNHVKLDRDLGEPGDPATAELFAFVEDALRK